MFGAKTIPNRKGDQRTTAVDVPPSAECVSDLDEILRRMHRQRSKLYGVHQLEDRRVGADAEREGEDRHRREAGIASQEATRLAYIAQHIVEPREAALIAEGLHGLRDASRFDHRRPGVLLAGVGISSRVLHRDFHVDPQFRFQVAIRPPSAQRPQEPEHPFAKYGHRLALVMPVRLAAIE